MRWHKARSPPEHAHRLIEMNTLYLDLFSGISGDMFVGALIDLGADPREIERQLARLQLPGYHLHVARAQKSAIEGIKFDVHVAGSHEHSHDHDHATAHEHGHSHSHGHGHAHPHTHEHDEHAHGRSFADIRELISSSSLSDWVKQKSVAVFQRLAAAEGKIHGVSPDQVHFHEVGAVDSIVDIVGACIALELLGKPRVLASPVVDGQGWIDCAHGRFPIPAPATLELLAERRIPISQCDEPHELVTPTGAALLAEFSESFAPMRALVPEKVGFGLGTRDNHTRPNVLRVVLGRSEEAVGSHDWETDTVTVLVTNLDDISAQVLGHVMQKALAAGALDIFYTPIQMKKNRPGVLLTLLCAESQADSLTELLLRETSSFGVRRHVCERRKLQREFAKAHTPFGEVTVKVGKLDGRIIQVAPEYESCRALAEKSGATLREIQQAAIQAVTK
jgi:pyridinium-3,5-bisthiocarboxylic acid mononucleotide nickel chelatase